ncbi:MAG: class I SAM-dependent methyltransferase [Bacteroidetes bacterium]|nr:class I SAM-dependent methyltransferase [Bacteroidota bacterium]
MDDVIHYTICPVCGSSALQKMLSATDYTVSKKEFDIYECADCRLRFTQNVPGMQSIGAYYQSPEYISHTDSRKGFINSAYHFVRKLTLSGKRKTIVSSSGKNSGKLLDIGAGTGAFAHYMQEHDWDVTGMEPDQDTRKRAAALHNINLLPADTFFNLSAATFDVITMWHVLEHVHDLHNYIDQLRNVLKDNGIIFIAVPNYTSYDADVYNEYWAAYDVPRHLYHFSPQSIRKLLTQHGLELKDIKPMWFDSFYISFLSERYRKGNLARGFFVGLFSNIKTLFNKERCSSLVYVIKKVDR